MSPRFATALLIVLSLISLSSWALPPPRYNYQAKLSDANGIPLSGTHTVFFSLYHGGDAAIADSGTLLFQESASLTIQSGVANHPIGTGVNLVGGSLTSDMMRTDSDTFIQVAVGVVENVVLPRARFESVPYATLASNAEARIPISGPLPLTISQKGSYYLTQNLSLDVEDQTGILITTGSVVLDLNGYVLTGPKAHLTNGSPPKPVPLGAPLGNSIGIRVKSAVPLPNVTIRNGTVEDWLETGISVNYGNAVGSAPGTRIEGITATHNGNTTNDGNGGIHVVAQDVLIEGCHAIANLNYGIFCSGRIVRNCTASYNVRAGFTVQGVVSQCISSRNTSYGFFLSNCTISDCESFENTQHGLYVQAHCIVQGVTSWGNAGPGFGSVGTQTHDCVFRNCVATSNTLEGIEADDSCLVENCTAKDNDSTGIVVRGSSRVTDSIMRGNEQGGLSALSSPGATLENNNLLANTNIDIYATSGTRVVNNHVRGTANYTGVAGGTCILTEGQCHVEGNTVENRSVGIRTKSAAVVVGNKGSGNSNNYILATGTNGPIVNAGTIGANTNPSANYSY